MARTVPSSFSRRPSLYRLSDQELEDIAKEDPVIHKQQLRLCREIEDLETARRILL